MATIVKEFTDLGFLVFQVPEAATLLMKGGAMIVSSDFSLSDGLEFQQNLLKL